LTAVGSKVEPFRLVRAVGEVVTSDELLAEGPLVLHFFPFAFTGSFAAGNGCEAQVCGFGARLDQFEALGVRLVAVSRDSPQVLAAWREQLGQRYEFLSDWEWQAARALGVLMEVGLETFRPLNTRGAFLIGADGVLRYGFVAQVISQLPPVEAVLEAALQLAAER
jgi:mycoredoxin-dependent peroxiredoxin